MDDALNDELNFKPTGDASDELGMLDDLSDGLGDDGLDMGLDRSNKNVRQFEHKPKKQTRKAPIKTTDPIKGVSENLNDQLTNEINKALDDEVLDFNEDGLDTHNFGAAKPDSHKDHQQHGEDELEKGLFDKDEMADEFDDDIDLMSTGPLLEQSHGRKLSTVIDHSQAAQLLYGSLDLAI